MRYCTEDLSEFPSPSLYTVQGPTINCAPKMRTIADKTRYAVKFSSEHRNFLAGSIGKKLYILVGGARTNDLLITKAYSTVALFLLCYFMKTYIAYIFDISIVGLPSIVGLSAVDSVHAVTGSLAPVHAVSGTHAVAGVSSNFLKAGYFFPGFVWMAERLNIPFRRKVYLAKTE